MAFFYCIVSVMVISVLSVVNTTTPDAFVISISILLAGWNISSAIKEKRNK